MPDKIRMIKGYQRTGKQEKQKSVQPQGRTPHVKQKLPPKNFTSGTARCHVLKLAPTGMAILEANITTTRHGAIQMRAGMGIDTAVLLEAAIDGGIIVSRIRKAWKSCARTNDCTRHQFAARYPD